MSGYFYRKTLTLDYSFPDNEFFYLTVINENTIELYHQSSGTTYRFKGKGYVQFKNAAESKEEIEARKASKLAKHAKA